MNGVRSIFKRKGYLFTALTVAVLLAASSGTAYGQVEAALDKELAEGASTSIEITVKISIPEGGAGGAVTITAGESTDSDVTAEEAADGDDVILIRPELELSYDAGKTADNDDTNNIRNRTSITLSGTIPVQAVQGDDDAEDEFTKITLEIVTTGDATGQVDGDDADTALDELPASVDALPLTIKDDETQTYVVTLNAGQKPTEGEAAIAVTVAAVPAHDDESKALTLISSDPVTYVLEDAESSFMLTSADNSEQAITIPAPPDKNRVADTFTLSLYSGVAGRSTLEDTLDIKVADANELPAVTAMVVDKDGKALVPQPTSVMEGESVMVAVMPLDEDGDVIAFTGEDLTVVLTPTGTADAADYTLVGVVHHQGRRRCKQCRRTQRAGGGRRCRHGIAHVRRRRVR